MILINTSVIAFMHLWLCDVKTNTEFVTAPRIKQERVDDREINQLAIEMAEKNKQKMLAQAAQIAQQTQASQQVGNDWTPFGNVLYYQTLGESILYSVSKYHYHLLISLKDFCKKQWVMVHVINSSWPLTPFKFI